MRMKMVCDDRTLRDVANEFLALKKAQKVRERTLCDYKKCIDKFLEHSANSLDVDILKVEILEYFSDIPHTSPARFNHPWIEWPGVIGCAEDFQTIADSAVEHMWFQDPKTSEQVKEVYLIRCEGDFIYGFDWNHGATLIFPEGTEVTSYFGSEFTYEEATLDWQSQTRIDH